MPTSFSLVRLFVSCPRDCQAERDSVAAVIDAINHSQALDHAIQFKRVDCANDVVPQCGKPGQQVVDEQLAEYDIYLGILSAHFGTAREEFESGTVHEFERALARFEQTKSTPWILFYFNDAPKLEKVAAAARQYAKVCEFRERLEQEDRTFGCACPCSGTAPAVRFPG